ncbi:nucleotidyltransferase-like protein [Fictibacillus terranigra]|uniref:Nucleotidyltransferase-like protein n=1 Tax=Fictibacillus terranigra TaxID=3058424 RepID=A0ABT8EBJ9_9BACL|nr:nucleotidyltransferase-like protein [Fictibacillus sp. CENA-BCM004]MDN4075265.1 nucleotidyltransferase-like protein [Fictibacillus sp. CENA-BCM004]
MEDVLRPLYQERASNENTLGVLLIEKNKPFSPLTDNFDCILFIIVTHADKPWSVKHYEFDDKIAALHIVAEERLNEWLLLGSNRRVVDWVINGKVLFNRNEYITELRDRLDKFPVPERSKKITIEFAKLLRRFSDGKELFHKGQHLDSFNHILHALHHLARLAVIERGFHPEITVWNQVKVIEPQIYKLYEELITGNESIDKRIELLLIASEFSISSKTKLGAGHLLNVFEEQQEWTVAELMEHREISDYSIDLGILLEHLIEKGIVDVIRQQTKGKNLFHRHYTTNK